MLPAKPHELYSNYTNVIASTFILHMIIIHEMYNVYFGSVTQMGWRALQGARKINSTNYTLRF